MKKLAVLLFTPFALFAQKDPCDKYFKKVKESYKSSVFAGENIVQTKYYEFVDGGRRNLYIQFKKTDKNYLVVRQQSAPGPSEFVLGTEMKIALIFEDKQIYTFGFTSSANTNFASGFNMSSNEIVIDEKLNDMLKKSKIVRTEILNAYGRANQSNVLKTQVFTGDDMMGAYNCLEARK